MDLNLRFFGFKLALNGISPALVMPIMVIWIVACFVAAPLVSIWALNTLFPVLMISYGFWEWLAMLVVIGILTQGSNRGN